MLRGKLMLETLILIKDRLYTDTNERTSAPFLDSIHSASEIFNLFQISNS